MNQIATVDQESAAKAARNSLTTLSSDGGGIVFHTVAEARDVAYLMSSSSLAVRKHLRDNPGACFGIVIQAVEWGMSPYAVANKSYVVNDQLAYESQLIQAVILRRAPLKGRIKFAFEGEDDNRVCVASAVTLDGETVEYRSPKFGKITPKNSPLWKSDPDQQHSYYSGRGLCRRHFPDVLLGIYDVEELGGTPMKDVSPPQGSGLTGRLQAGSEGGFDPAVVSDTLQEAGASVAQASSPETAEETSDPETGEVFSKPKPSAKAKQQPKPDLDEAAKQGERAAFAGDGRDPGDMLPEERDAWLAAYDKVSAEAAKS